MKTKKFNSYEEYEAWTEQFEDCYEHQYIPTVIDNGWVIAMDMFTDCKTWKTALNRFEKAFADHDESIKGWIQTIRESCENEYFHDACQHSCKTHKEVLEEARNFGTYNWSVEEVDDGRWYIFLNISGAYADRQREAV